MKTLKEKVNEYRNNQIAVWREDEFMGLVILVLQEARKAVMPKKIKIDDDEYPYCSNCGSKEADSGCNCQGWNEAIDEINKRFTKFLGEK